MADFPVFKIDRQSKQLDRDGRIVDYDGDGIAAVRKLHADRADFNLVLSRMNSTDKTALFNHYAAHPTGVVFNFGWPPDGATYIVKYGKRPELVDFNKNQTWTYRVILLCGG